MHIDQLGEWDYLTLLKAVSISVKLTVESDSGYNLVKLSGNDRHLQVRDSVVFRSVSRTPDRAATERTISECGVPLIGSAAGSVQIQGLVSKVSFAFEIDAIDELDEDSILIAWEGSCEIDADGDGLNDSIDLDDDNDGILDDVELQGDDFLDTDGDDLIDSIDIDSDNDGCFDVIEAGFEDPDANGTLGNAPDQVDSQGRVINETTGYTRPLDVDGNGIFDFQEGAPPKVLEHPKNVTTDNGASINMFSVATIYDNIQWQVSIDKGVDWKGLKESSIYSNVNSTTLLINDTPLSFDGYLYRAKYQNCGISFFSDAMSLSVILGYPNFFTPNNDGSHDFWKIKGLDNTSHTIFIYDRFGRLLKTLTEDSEGWDGTFGDLDMPASDYWFKYNDIAGNQLVGHFALIR